MFTTCPKCSRQFRIYAEQIVVAAGRVRCGFCRQQFDALQYLHDMPEEKDDASSAITVAAATTINPAPAEDNDQPIEEPQFDLSESVVESADNESESQIDSVRPHVKAKLQQAVDELLLEESTATSSSKVKVVWGFALFLALFAIISQLAWFNRDHLLMQYPEAGPYVKQLCEKLDCKVIRQHNPTAITMINRDVRLHPIYEDTLLVNATIKNELAVKQAYPRVQFMLFDTDGSVLGYRKFEPTDYLDSSIDIESGMPVNTPVNFVLEISGASVEAVSFEFRFLQ